MKKLLCLLLAGLMLLSTVACGESSENGDGSAGEKQTNASNEKDTQNTDYVCDLPSDLNYGGETVNILFTDMAGKEDELVADDSGSIVSEAVHTRNVTVEEQLGVTLATFTKPDATQVVNAMKLDITSNTHEYDIVTNGTYLSVQPALEGYYVNLTPLQNINTAKHYWTQGYNDMVTFTDADMQFLASGPIAISMFRYMYLTIYNKQLFNDYQETDLYEVVKAGEWTLDYQYQVLADKYNDVDGVDGRSEDDFYGFVTGDTISVDPYMVSTGVQMIIKDAGTGELCYNSEAQDDLVAVCNAVQKLYNDQSTYVYKTATYDDVQHTNIINHFNNGLAMMATTLFLQMELNFEDLSQLTYGIAPIPKLTKEQKNYGSYVQDQVSSFGISAGVADPERREMLAAVLEAMAYHSYLIVRPAYYETALSERYMQDPQSNEVLDMIFNTLQFDFSSSCSNIITSCVIRDNLRPLLSGSKNTITSSTKNWGKVVNNKLRSYNDKLEEKKDEA